MNLDLMLLIDKRPSDLETPFYDVQQMTSHLRNEGYAATCKRIRRLMQLMAEHSGSSHLGGGVETHKDLPVAAVPDL